MKTARNSVYVTAVLLIVMLLAACSKSGTGSQASSSIDSSTKDAGFSYRVMDETYKEGGISIKYPQLFKASSNEKSDSVNKAIQSDIRNYIDKIKNETGSDLTVDMNYEIAGYKDKVLSIAYTGLSSVKGAVYPVNVYHTCSIDLDSTDFIPLKSLFKIDAAFVERFLSGMYSPYSKDLDLEKSNADIKKAITDQYSNDDLIKLFSEDAANYKLTDQGVLLSVEVPHAIGDHLEMAINYESIESNMIRENKVWKDYLFIAESDANGSDDSFAYKTYSNPRFGFQLSYPDFYSKSTESDNGDGISLESVDGLKTLKIWGSYNVNNATGKTLLKDAENRVSEISGQIADDQFYSIDYEGGGDGQPILFHECGYITGGTIIGYVISYPDSDKDKYKEVIDHMTKELKAIKVSK